MASTEDVRYSRWLRRTMLLLLGGAATALGALLLTAGPASAQPLNIPGIGTFEIPGRVPVPAKVYPAVQNIPEVLDISEGDIPASPATIGPEFADLSRPTLTLPTAPGFTIPLPGGFEFALPAGLPAGPVVPAGPSAELAALAAPGVQPAAPATPRIELSVPGIPGIGIAVSAAPGDQPAAPATPRIELSVPGIPGIGLDTSTALGAWLAALITPGAGLPAPPAIQPSSPPAAGFSLPTTLFGIELPFLSGIPGVQPPATPGPSVAPQKSKGALAVEAARAKIGSGYRMGSVGPDAFDCSGLVQWSYSQVGVDVPRTSYQQLASGTPVSQDDLQPGDVVSFYGGGHSALYAGDGKVIHAGTYSTGVTEAPMASMPFAGARRF